MHDDSDGDEALVPARAKSVTLGLRFWEGAGICPKFLATPPTPSSNARSPEQVSLRPAIASARRQHHGRTRTRSALRRAPPASRSEADEQAAAPRQGKSAPLGRTAASIEHQRSDPDRQAPESAWRCSSRRGWRAGPLAGRSVRRRCSGKAAARRQRCCSIKAAVWGQSCGGRSS